MKDLYEQLSIHMIVDIFIKFNGWDWNVLSTSFYSANNVADMHNILSFYLWPDK